VDRLAVVLEALAEEFGVTEEEDRLEDADVDVEVDALTVSLVESSSLLVTGSTVVDTAGGVVGITEAVVTVVSIAWVVSATLGWR
jgi:hypothetical protein